MSLSGIYGVHEVEPRNPKMNHMAQFEDIFSQIMVGLPMAHSTVTSIVAILTFPAP